MKDFTIVRKGFDTTEVDTYIVDLEAEIAKRDKKLEEYRSKEDAIKRAVVDAQLIADAIQEVVDTAGQDGALIIATDHSFHEGIPTENVLYFLDKAKELGKF